MSLVRSPRLSSLAAVALAATAALGAGCGSKKKDPPPAPAGSAAPRPADPVAPVASGPVTAIPAASGTLDPTLERILAAMPVDADVVGGLSIERLLTNPTIRGQADKAVQGRLPFDLKAECGLDPMTAIKKVVFASKRDGLARGAITGLAKGQVMPCLEKAKPKIEAEGGTLTIDGVYAWGKAGERAFGLAFIDDSTAMFEVGREGAVVDRAALEAMASSTPGSGITSSAEFMAMIKTVNTDVTGWGVANGRDLKSQVPAMVASFVPDTKAVMFAVDAGGGGLAVDLRLRTMTDADAQSVVDGLGAQVKAMLSAGLASRAELLAEGADVHGVITMNEAQLARIGGMIKSMLPMIMGLDAQRAAVAAGRAGHAVSARAALVVGALALATGCSRKPEAAPAPPLAVAGLSAVPADASAVISIDATRVHDSPLVARALGLLVGQAPGLRERWTALASRCQLALGGDVRRIVVALGARTAAPQPTMLVVQGAVDEARFAACLLATVGAGAGTVTETKVDGRRRLVVRDAGRTVWLSYGQPDTLVASTSDAWLHAAVTSGPKVGSDAAWQRAVAQADQGAPIWAVGQVPSRVGDQLVRVAGGAVSAGPSLYTLAVDLAAGARVELGAVLASDADATALHELADGQLGLLAMAAQLRGLGPVVAKVRASVAGPVFRLTAGLSDAEAQSLLDLLDPVAAPVDTAPAGPAGLATGSAAAPASAPGAGSASAPATPDGPGGALGIDTPGLAPQDARP
ncbi:MAG: hypothetical protein R2939_16875 [Kofleriaceae bacterium]